MKEQRRIEEGKMSKMSIVQQRRPGQGTMGKEMGTGMDRNPPRVVEKKLERTKNKGATEGGIADGVRKKRMIPMSSFEMKALNRYKRYSIDEIEKATDYFSADRKIGEGGYGPVYKCFLDQTAVAIKTLRLDAAQGRSQFQQEIEVLGGMRHPNMVLLLGACPEHGCLVYEYMSNGSLEEQLFPRNKKTPPIILPLPWQLRFRISAEICTALLFLHQTKPKPLVHRDLKPANILLDSNYVSKISDVGLARIVPANNSPTATSTQYHMTSAAGTFCYIDPEYQQTGLLGVKSDVYSLGILLLQVITGKQPMGLTHHVEAAIENDVFEDILDPAVKDWPIQQALQFAQMALQCAELRRKDRPDLGTEVLPLMNKLRAFADDHHLTYDDVTQVFNFILILLINLETLNKY